MNDHSNDEEPKVIVDLRMEFPEVRDQGHRPACLAFAASDAHSNFQGFNQHLSVEYLIYYAYLEDGHQDYSLGISTSAAIKALSREGQPFESDWPYNPNQNSPLEPIAGLSPIYKVNYVKNLSWSVSEFIKILDERKAIVIGISIKETFFKQVSYPHIIEDQGELMGLHALILVGYGKLSSGNVLFLLRNSWGQTWGNNGYSWLTESYLKNNMNMYMTFN